MSADGRAAFQHLELHLADQLWADLDSLFGQRPDDLLRPGVLAQEVVDNLQMAVEQFQAIAEKLKE